MLQGEIMPRINKPYPLTPEQRAEVMRKQIEREPDRIKRWEEERQRQIAAEKERGKIEHSLFQRGFNPS